jgi:hypothetical protein
MGLAPLPRPRGRACRCVGGAGRVSRRRQPPGRFARAVSAVRGADARPDRHSASAVDVGLGLGGEVGRDARPAPRRRRRAVPALAHRPRFQGRVPRARAARRPRATAVAAARRRARLHRRRRDTRLRPAARPAARPHPFCGRAGGRRRACDVRRLRPAPPRGAKLRALSPTAPAAGCSTPSSSPAPAGLRRAGSPTATRCSRRRASSCSRASSPSGSMRPTSPAGAPAHGGSRSTVAASGC